MAGRAAAARRGCGASSTRAHYRVILFDQRGCGRSSPNASVENNTTWDLVADIERIRVEMRIDRWTVFGGSWGACLALVYAQTHPDRVRALVLRGVFTMTPGELDWFYGGGAGGFWPDQWAAFAGHGAGGGARRPDRRLPPAAVRRRPGRADALRPRLGRLGVALAVLDPGDSRGYPSASYALAFARLENHYFTHGGFLDGADHIMARMDRIAHIPGHIVQGRYDMICPPHTAHRLHQAWPGSTLRMVTHAGHALSEPGISSELVAVMDGLRG